jgi:TatD DNase family protein
MAGMFVDSHCHLTFPELHGRIAELRREMQAAQVDRALCICTTIEEFPAVHELARTYDNFWASAGVHPDNEGVHEPDVDELLRLAALPRVVAIGETGLDYYRLKEPLDWQRERFRVHIRAARAADKPLIIHTRSASADTLRLMREEGAEQAGGVLHCFTESWEVAEAAMQMGFYISFSGIVTFKNATDLQEVARRVPLERLLIETDAPYLAPVPHRGKTNEPGFVPHVAAMIGQLKGLDTGQVAKVSSDNFFRLFKRLNNKLNVE